MSTQVTDAADSGLHGCCSTLLDTGILSLALVSGRSTRKPSRVRPVTTNAEVQARSSRPRRRRGPDHPQRGKTRPYRFSSCRVEVGSGTSSYQRHVTALSSPPSLPPGTAKGLEPRPSATSAPLNTSSWSSHRRSACFQGGHHRTTVEYLKSALPRSTGVSTAGSTRWETSGVEHAARMPG